MCDKRCLTKREAEAILKKVGLFKKRHRKVPQRYYYCDNCNCWHLTSKPDRKEDSLNEEFTPLEQWKKYLNET